MRAGLTKGRFHTHREKGLNHKSQQKKSDTCGQEQIKKGIFMEPDKCFFRIDEPESYKTGKRAGDNSGTAYVYRVRKRNPVCAVL